MIEIYPIKFDFNDHYKRKINESEKKFYLSTLAALTARLDLFWVNETKNNIPEVYNTIPVYSTSEIETSDILLLKFIDWTNNIANICKKDDFLISDFYLCIDLTGIKRDNQFGLLCYTLLDFVEFAKQKGEVKIFIFLDDLLSENDNFFNLLKPNFDNKTIYIIDTLGNYLPLEDNKNFSKATFYEKRKNTLLDYKQAIKSKLVRKLGHFKVKDKDSICNRYFYDGSFCETEISHLVKEYIEKNSSSKKNFEYILYMTKYSPWLEKSMFLLDAELSVLKENNYPNYKGHIRLEDVENYIKPNYNGGEILLIADLLNTGTSLQTEIENLYTTLPNLKSENLLLLSVMNINTKSNGAGKRAIKAKGKDFLVSYFIDVELLWFETHNKCPMCKIGIPQTQEINDESCLKLTSYTFWELSDKAKYGEENYGVELAKRYKTVTKMTKWFEENSAYIVYKYLHYLEANEIEVKNKTIFVYPDEKLKNEGEISEELDTPSYKLASSLKSFINAKEIGIPRYLIDKYKNPEADINDLENNTDEWKEILITVSPNYNYVIIDEFHRDGETFKSMYRILDYCKRKPTCYFPVIDFNPLKSKTYSTKYDNLKVLNLYEFNNNRK